MAVRDNFMDSYEENYLGGIKMKNMTKAFISVGVGSVGMHVFAKSIKSQNNKVVWNLFKGLPGIVLMSNGLIIAGAYAANPNFSVTDNVKCILHKK